MELPRSLVKNFADLANSKNAKEKPSNNVRGTIKMVSDKKFVQLDGSDALTPLIETVDVQDEDRVLVTIENHMATVIGNYSYPPSARKEQEAIDKAEDAGNKADDAVGKAEDAGNKADQAGSKADQAIEEAGKASGHAEEAKKNAQEAIDAANKVTQDLEDAKTAAQDAASSAEEAKKHAEQAQNAVVEANKEIERIEGEVSNVRGDIGEAMGELEKQASEIQATKENLELNYTSKTETSEIEATLRTEISKKVGELKTTVEETYAGKNDIVDLEGKLQSQITQNASGLQSVVSKTEKLESDTADAQDKVDQALSSAFDAQAAADQAKIHADKAQVAADEAKANSDIAVEKATKAQEEADAARKLADSADQKLTEAETALDEAKKNLQDIIDSGGSEEDIAAAEQRVEEARIAVEKALTDATEAEYMANKAQQAADKSKEEAAEAQRYATQAQQKADNAKIVADKAMEAARIAQEKVASLTKRVDDAESAIRQNSEAIELAVSKTTEIGDLLKNDYYNKTETDAKIKVESDRIDLTVSKVEVVEKSSITSSVEQFYLSTSPTSLSGGSWSTSQPTWTQGKYIWRRTLVTKGDGTTSYNPSQNGVCISGNTGATGAKGDKGETGDAGPQGPQGNTGPQGPSGKGIKSTAITYQASTSGTTAPTGTWSSTIPSVSQGQYLWSRTVITYTDNTTSTTYSVAYIPKNGSTGATGPAGPAGATGANGTGVASIEQQYYLSTSKTTQTGGSWVTSMPTWSSGKYLWTRYVITYTNPSKTEYTSPICDSSWEAANDVANDLKNNYYTKTQTDAKIEVESERITSTVTKVEIIEENTSEALGLANSNQTQITESMSEIAQLSNQISSLVKDDKGNSLMVQDSSGWHFNIGAIQNKINDATNALTNVTNDLDTAEALLNSTKNMVDALDERTAFINITTVDNQPAIILGQSNSKFKLRITNTSIDFLDGSEAIAYISNQTLYITKAIIKDEIQIGERTGWIWKRRPNGNLGLRWSSG